MMGSREAELTARQEENRKQEMIQDSETALLSNPGVVTSGERDFGVIGGGVLEYRADRQSASVLDTVLWYLEGVQEHIQDESKITDYQNKKASQIETLFFETGRAFRSVHYDS
jgi:hypothetical protein